MYFRILFFDSLEYHGKTFFKHRRDEVFVAHTEVFQVEGLRVPGFRTHLGPWAFGRVAVGPFDEVQYAFYIFRHFFHGDAHLTCASDGRVLATHTGCNDGQRFRPDILAELEVLIIPQAFRLMVAPQVALRFAGFQRSNRLLPIINVVQTVSMSHTAAREAHELRFQIGQRLS